MKSVNLVACPISATIFILNSCLPFTSAANIQVHFRLDFFLEANNMNPDQTAPLLFAIYAT